MHAKDKRVKQGHALPNIIVTRIMQPADVAEKNMQGVSSYVDEWNREMMSASFNRSAELISLDMNFQDTARCMLPIRTFIYLPPIFLSYISRQTQTIPVFADEGSDDDEGPPELIGDSDDDDSDSSLSCNSTIASIYLSDEFVDNFSDNDGDF